MGQFQVANVRDQFNRGQQFTTDLNQQQALQEQEQALFNQQQQASQFEQVQKERMAPLKFQQAKANLLGTQQKNSQAAEMIKLKKNIISAQELESIPSENKAAFLRNKIISGEAESQPRDMTESRKALQLIEAGREQEITQGAEQLFKIGRQLGVIKAPAGQGVSAESNAFNNLIKDFTPEQKRSAKLVKAGLKGRAMSNAVLSAIQSGDVNSLAEANAVIKQAEKFGAMTGASRAKAIDSGFDKIQKINVGISNLDKGIELIKSGAGSGSLERLLPSIKASTVALNNLQNTMALDVIGAVTFGALSQGELDLAKTVALNTRLDGPDLILDLQSRKAAQEKLRNYFNEQVQFLDQGGTVAGFLREKERQQAALPEQAQPQLVGDQLSDADLLKKYGG